jgi:hypothetical protein
MEGELSLLEQDSFAMIDWREIHKCGAKLALSLVNVWKSIPPPRTINGQESGK